MFTMILLIYLQTDLTVNLVGATVSGEFKTLASCQKAAVRKRGPLPIPRGYHAASQDTMCIAINRDVTVGNERRLRAVAACRARARRLPQRRRVPPSRE
jgi:hypothetical protein